jgi:D-alanine-D-alanine ligase/UDP-N-acetylmuramate--alanine ligase
MEKIAIIHGGFSTEQQISTQNACYVEAALSRLGYQPFMVNYNVDMIEELRKINPQLVWICVQGKGHGDGTIQSVLDFLGIKYTGSGAMAAQIINNKIVCKKLFDISGVRTPAWQVLSRSDYQTGSFDFSGIGYPFVAKAPTQGGGFGIELVMSSDEHGKIAHVFDYDDPILIEKYICGDMTTVGLLHRNNQLEIFPAVGVESTKNKNDPELIKFDIPRSIKRSNFKLSLESEITDFAKKVFNITCAKSYARVDFMVSDDQEISYVLEINAVPGLKPKDNNMPSLFPIGASEAGIDYDNMIESIVLDAL